MKFSTKNYEINYHYENTVSSRHDFTHLIVAWKTQYTPNFIMRLQAPNRRCVERSSYESPRSVVQVLSDARDAVPVRAHGGVGDAPDAVTRPAVQRRQLRYACTSWK